MFSVGYNNKAMIINAVDIQHISGQNVENLRRLVIQLLKNPCGKIILDLKGINMVDSPALEIIDRLNSLASTQNVIFEFSNVDSKVKSLFSSAGFEINTVPLNKIVDSKTIRN
jgi:MFS superfamily sulfate permease-like transporter